MYLIAHQNDCQMVVGSIMKIRTPESLRETWEGDAVIGFENSDRNMPRQCTCEPQQINWEKLVLAIGGGGHVTFSELYE